MPRGNASGAWPERQIRANLAAGEHGPRATAAAWGGRRKLQNDGPKGKSVTRQKGPGAVKSVLVVDDEPNIVLSLEFLMQQAGFDVRVARDGEQALAAMLDRTPDLVLLDVMIPRGDGYGVCKAVRANPAWRDVRIVMLTAKGRDSERERGIALGADDYITKPFSTREVVGRVKELLGVASG